MRKTRLIAMILTVAMCIVLLPSTALATSAATIADELNAAGLSATYAGDIVTVTGVITNAAATLALDLDADVTVIWKAEVTGGAMTAPLLTLNGSGTFEVAEGGSLIQAVSDETTATAITSGADVTVNVTGGTVASRNAIAIFSDGGDVNISGGTVSSEYNTAVGCGDITISGVANVYTASTSGSRAAVNSTKSVTVEGGTVSAISAGHAVSSSGGPIIIQGDAVVTAEDGFAVYFSGGIGGVTIGGNALVTATTGRAVFSTNTVQPIAIKDNATLFAYGGNLFTGSVIVVAGDGSNISVSDNALVLGWTDQSVTDYYAKTKGDLVESNLAIDGSVIWDVGETPGTGGVAYKNGTNTGFIPLPVTVVVPTIAVQPPNLSFKVGEALNYSNDEINFVISNDTFKADMSLAAVASIINGLPAGVTIAYVTHNSSDDTEIIVVLEGAPTEAGSGKITIVGAIPSEYFTNYPEPITPSGEIEFTVVKGDGAAVVTPPSADGTPAHDTITLTEAILASGTTQSVEYAISTTNAPPLDGWTSSLEYTNLDPETTYYVFARSAENADYEVGVPCAGVEISTTKPKVALSGVAADDGVAYLADTTTLTLTFSVPIDGFDDTMISVDGAAKGALSGSGDTYTLTITNLTVNEGEEISITVTLPVEYELTGGNTKAVAVNREVTVTVSTQSDEVIEGLAGSTEYVVTTQLVADGTDLTLGGGALEGVTIDTAVTTGDTTTITIRTTEATPSGTHTLKLLLDGVELAEFELEVTAEHHEIALDITEHAFPAATVGYAAQTEVTITVTNLGNYPTGELTLTLGGVEFELGTATLTSIDVGESAMFTVVPTTGLSAAAYVDCAMVTGANSLTASLEVSFIVKPASSGGYWPPAPPIPTTPPTETGTGDNDDGPKTIITDDGTIIEVPGGSTITDNGKITVGDDGATIIYTDGGTGEMPGGFEFQLDPDAPHGFRALTSLFDDVHTGDWFFDDIHGAYFLRLMIGTSLAPPLFSPDMSTTRATIITVMRRLEMARTGSADYAKLSNFDDVPDNTWFTESVAWGEENEIVYGIGGGLYAPDVAVTRQDLAAILMRYAVYAGIDLPALREPSEFVDDDEISDYAAGAVEALYCAGVINGKPGGVFDPKGYATRAELAAMLTRFIAFTDVQVSVR